MCSFYRVCECFLLLRGGRFRLGHIEDNFHARYDSWVFIPRNSSKRVASSLIRPLMLSVRGANSFTSTSASFFRFFRSQTPTTIPSTNKTGETHPAFRKTLEARSEETRDSRG